MEQLSVAEGKLGNVMTRLLGVDIFNKKLEMDEERCEANINSLIMIAFDFDWWLCSLFPNQTIRFVPEGLGYKTDLFEEEPEKKKDDVDSGPEEEEVTFIPFPFSLVIPLFPPRCRLGDTWNASRTWFLMPRVEASEGGGNVRVALSLLPQFSQEAHSYELAYHLISSGVHDSCLLSKLSSIEKHFVPVLRYRATVRVMDYLALAIVPLSHYFPSIFIPFYCRPSVMWQLWKRSSPLKSDQNLDTRK